ncbi:MAG: DUF192 domain-containing protein [Candidatus Paceibacterota bacterium]|jgi:hypothetical protein
MNGRSEAIRRLILLIALVAFLVLSGLALKKSLFDNAKETASQIYERTGGVLGEPKSGAETINVLIADDDAKRTLGLGGRKSLPDDSVMLFIFPKPDSYGIWMKDMKFPIDIFWLDENFSVIDEKINVATSTYPEIFYPNSKASFVLEGNAGFAEKRGIRVGSVLKFLK